MNLEQAEPLVFINEKGHKFKLDANVIAQLNNFVQNHPSKPEAGGILLGRHIINSCDIIVDKITMPMKEDRGSRFRFFRTRKAHQKVVDEEWKASNGTMNYLGEWHTHPEAHPLPSGIDLENWKQRLQKSKFDSESLFFIIVGQKNIVVWQGYKTTKALEQLKPYSY